MTANPTLESIAAACAEYDRVAEWIGTCTDGGCLVLRPQGMHTNGGCKCSTDPVKAQRMMRAGQTLRAALASLKETKHE